MNYERTILITGGAGFIGSHVVRRFVTKYPQCRIINLDALTYAGNLENLRDVEHAANYTFVKADICDAEALAKVFKDFAVDGVIHLAAESHVDRSITDPLSFVRTNVLESSSGDGGRAARARGLSTLQYVARHGVAQAVVPLLTLAGFLIPRLVGGSLLIEAIFNVPGLGSLLFASILARDLPVVLALTLVSGLATLTGTTVSDVLIVWLDPRVRHAS